MDIDEFEIELHQRGYTEIVTRDLEPGYFLDKHAHPFDARAYITDGDFTLTVGGESRTYTVGTIFELPAGCIHEERAGAVGATYRVGRRAPASP